MVTSKFATVPSADETELAEEKFTKLFAAINV
jgi:hypothetical protein